MQSIARILLAISLVAFAVGCDKTTTQSIGKNARPTIAVVEAGAEPRQPLRFAPPKGQANLMIMTMSMGMEMNGIPTPETPAMVMTMNTEVTKVKDNGDFEMKFDLSKVDVLDSPNVAPEIQSTVRGILKSMIGLKGTQSTTNRGIAIDADLTMPPDVNAQVKQMLQSMMRSLDQLLAPMPEDAVGLGAKWTTTMPMQLNGMSLTQVAHNEITAIEGSVVTIKLEMTQRADPQTVKPPGMPSFKLLSLDTTASGLMTLDLTKVVPVSSMEMTSKSKLEAGGQSMDMVINMSTTIQRK